MSARASMSSVTPVQDASKPAGRDGEWRLIFEDDFQGASIDSKKWTTCYWWGRDGCNISSNEELEWYQPDDVLVQHVTAHKARQWSIFSSTETSPSSLPRDWVKPALVVASASNPSPCNSRADPASHGFATIKTSSFSWSALKAWAF